MIYRLLDIESKSVLYMAHYIKHKRGADNENIEFGTKKSWLLEGIPEIEDQMLRCDIIILKVYHGIHNIDGFSPTIYIDSVTHSIFDIYTSAVVRTHQ